MGMFKPVFLGGSLAAAAYHAAQSEAERGAIQPQRRDRCQGGIAAAAAAGGGCSSRSGAGGGQEAQEPADALASGDGGTAACLTAEAFSRSAAAARGAAGCIGSGVPGGEARDR